MTDITIQEPTSTLIDPQSVSHPDITLPNTPPGFLHLVKQWGKKMPPIKVRRTPGNGYTLIDGRRRLAAALKLNWTQIPAIVEAEPVPGNVTRTTLPGIPHGGQEGWK